MCTVQTSEELRLEGVSLCLSGCFSKPQAVVWGVPRPTFRKPCANFSRSSPAKSESLRGEVEVDETWIGGTQAELRGSRQLKGRKAALVLVAVEKRGRVTGRARMAVIPDFKSATLLGFLKENVALGSTVYTDGLKSFAGLQQAGFQPCASPSAPANRSAQRREVGSAFGRPRHWQSPAMADRNLSRREPRSASGLS